MKYIVRALKYFVYISLIVTVIMLILVALKLVSPDVNVMFREGWGSILKIAVMFLAVSAIYPKFGYGKRRIRAKGSTDEILPKIEAHMNDRGYVLVSRDAEDNLVFRQASFISRLFKMFEDKVYFTRALSGYEMEGRLKDIVRLDTAFYQIFEETDE